MKRFNKIKSISIIASMLMTLLMIAVSCEENKFFEYVELPSYYDGIQNLDEEGVDCGGQSGVVCPTCNDGILNNGEEKIDCGGSNCAACPEAAIGREFNYLALQTPMFHTFETVDTSMGLKGDNTADNDVTPQGADFPMVTFGVEDPTDELQYAGRYNRPAGLINDGFSDFKFAKADTNYDFSANNQFEISVYTPAGTIADPVTPTVEIIFLNRDEAQFWTTWTILSATLTKTDEWEHFTFDGSSMAGRTDYNQIAIRIGGSNHQSAATFYIKDFAVRNVNVVMAASFANTTGVNLNPDNPTDNDLSSQGVTLPMMNLGFVGPNEGYVGRYNRPEGLINDEFSDFKFAKSDTKYTFSNTSKVVLEVYTPEGVIVDPVTNTVEIIFLDRDNGQFWTTWTILNATLTKTGEWETLTFDGSALGGRTEYDQIAIRIGGSNHQVAATFYIRNFNVFNND